MPDLTSHASTFRAGRYQYTGYLGVIPPTVVFSRAVNMASIPEDQITSITFDDAYSGAGVYTDVREDMTVLVYDGNTSTLKGRLRVAAGGASSTVLQVNEYSPGTLQLADDDRFDVVAEWRIWDKLVEASALFRKDSRVTFSAQTDDYKPVANGGGAVFTFVDSGQSYATIDFDWTDSFPVDPDNSNGVTYSVDQKDATITAGTSTSSTCTMQVPAGFRHLELTVTDADNSASSTIQIPVYVYDNDTYTPLSASIDNLRFDSATKGWVCDGLRLPQAGQAALASLPDGAMVVYFERETYGGTVASYGSNAPATGRSQMKFVGYLVADTLTLTPDGDELVFEALSPLGILEQTAALPQLMIRDASPSNWQEAKGLTVNLALWYLWYWHASIASIFDFLWVDGTDLAYSRLAVEDTSSVAGQLRDIASSINVELTCDRLGRLLLIRDPNYLTLSERSSRTVVYNATTADITELEERHTHRRSVKVVVGEGITPGATEAAQSPVFSLAPGKAPGEGTGVDTFSRKIATQTNLNLMTGERYASVNGLFWDESTGAIRPVPQGARWSVPDGYDWLDPAYMEFLTLTLPASSNARGVAYTTGTRWLVREVSIGYDADAGSKDIQWTLDHETHGPSGVTDNRPRQSENGLPSFPDWDITLPGWGDYIPPGDVGTVYLNQGTQRIAAPAANGLPYTSNFGSGDLTEWDYTSWSALSVSGTFIEWVPNGFEPGSGWIVTSTGVYYGALPTGPFTLNHTFTTATIFRSADASFGTANHFVVVTYYDDVGTKALYTTDNTTFTEVVVTSNYVTGVGQPPAYPGCYVSPKTAGLVYTGAHTATSLTPASSCYRSLDYGATWVAVSNPLFPPSEHLHAAIHVPYAANSETLLYTGRVADTASTPTSNLTYKVNGGAYTNVSPSAGGNNYHPDAVRNAFQSYVGNQNILYMVGIEAPTLTHGFFRSTNAAASWTTLDAPTNVRGVAISGDNPNTVYAFGVSDTILLASDGLTFVSQAGNLSTFSVGQIAAVAGY